MAVASSTVDPGLRLERVCAENLNIRPYQAMPAFDKAGET